MGKRTSIYLSDTLADAVAASGLPLAGLIRRGLTASASPAGPARERSPKAPAAAALAPAQPAQRRRCPHPGTRVIGGYCPPCGVMAEPGGYLPG